MISKIRFQKNDWRIIVSEVEKIILSLSERLTIFCGISNGFQKISFFWEKV